MSTMRKTTEEDQSKEQVKRR